MRLWGSTHSPTAAPLAAAALACALLAAPGCGEYVAYDESFRLPGGGSTLDGFMPTTLDHLQLRGLMASYTLRSKDDVHVLVDYDALAASPEARMTLEQYRAMLAAVDPAKLASRDERLAYWINGYNASVVSGVITRYKGSASWKATDSGMFFDDPLFTFGGQQITLNHLEQGVLRGDWGYPGLPRSGKLLDQLKDWHKDLWAGGTVDARFHAAINCAAVSCPNLLDAAPFSYEPETLDAQLTTATRAWLDSPQKGAGADGISALFSWYAKDFEDSGGGSVDAFIAKYRTDGLKGVDTKTTLTYDWTLNIKGNK